MLITIGGEEVQAVLTVQKYFYPDEISLRITLIVQVNGLVPLGNATQSQLTFLEE